MKIPKWLVLKLELSLLSGPFHPTLFQFIPIFNRDLAPGMLHCGEGRVCPDGVGPGHVTYGVKRVEKGSL